MRIHTRQTLRRSLCGLLDEWLIPYECYFTETGRDSQATFTVRLKGPYHSGHNKCVQALGALMKKLMFKCLPVSATYTFDGRNIRVWPV